MDANDVKFVTRVDRKSRVYVCLEGDYATVHTDSSGSIPGRQKVRKLQRAAKAMAGSCTAGISVSHQRAKRTAVELNIQLREVSKPMEE
jgi:hypothetical protein